MKNTLVRTFLMPVILLNAYSGFAQSKIKDNTIMGSPVYPHPGAVLEIESSSRGVLMPRISLSSTTSWGLSGTDTAGIVVYNNNPGISDTSTAPALSGGVGFYYWDGKRWVGMGAGSGSGDFWRLKGNTGTTAPLMTGAAAGSAHYVGTADTQNLAIGTNGIVRAILDRNGNLYGGNNSSVGGSGINSLVWGNNNTDSASYALVSGNNNALRASASYSVVSGSDNKAGGTYGAVFGQLNNDSANYSIVAGISNILSPGANNSLVTGASNILQKSNTSPDGVSVNMVNGQDNILTAQGTGGAAFNHVSGFSNTLSSGTAAASYNMLCGSENLLYSARNAAVFGRNNKDSVSYTLMAGRNNTLSAAALHSTVTGFMNYLGAPNAAVFGQNHKDSASNSQVSGYNNTLASSANGSIVSGGNQFVQGNHSAVFGQEHKDSANYSLIAGQANIVSPGMHHAMVSGSFNQPVDDALLILGNGTSAARSNAFVVTKRKTSGAATNGLIILSAPLPKYASVGDANADASLPPGAFFRVNTAVHQKD